MYEVLRYMGLGDHMIHCIARVYITPQALVKINWVFWKPFKISNGTRRGCPLSPLLFALSLESLLNKIRQNPDIRGLQLGEGVYKVSAYADNFLFSMSNPPVSLPNLMKVWKLWSCIKSTKKMTPNRKWWGLHCRFQNVILYNLTFNWVSSALKYWGTNIPSNLGNTFTANFPPL